MGGWGKGKRGEKRTMMIVGVSLLFCGTAGDVLWREEGKGNGGGGGGYWGFRATVPFSESGGAVVWRAEDGAEDC